MRKQHTLTPSVLSLALGLGAATAAQAGMQTYTCQFGPPPQAKLVIEYDTATSRFGLIDYYGAPSLPSGMQVEAFDANAALLGFTLNAFTNGTLTEASTYRFDFLSGRASLVRYTMQNAPVTLEGSCIIGTAQASTPITPPPAAPQPASPPPASPPATPPAISASAVRTTNSYHCRYEGLNEAGISFAVSPETGTFALTDYYGATALKTHPDGGFGSQLGAVSLEGATLEFSVERTYGTEVVGGDTFTVDLTTLATTASNYEINNSGQPVELEARAGSCTQIAKSGQSADQAVTDAIAQARQAPAPFISFTPQPRQNTICARDDRPTASYAAVTWCVSTTANPQGGASFGPDSLFTPNAAWCTANGAWGINDTVEISFEGLAPGSSIRAVALVNGASLESADYFTHSRPRQITFEGETGGYRWEQLEDRPAYQAIAFSEPLSSDWIRLKIADVFPAMNANHNACISQIVVVFGQ